MSANRKNVYGNDMLYVAADDGSRVGRINLKTGKVTMDRHDLRDEFDRFVATWRSTWLDDLAPVTGGRRSGERRSAHEVLTTGRSEPAPTTPNDPPQPATPGALPVPSPATTATRPVAPGIAGASAQRAYERRSTRELATKQERVAQDAEWRSQIKTNRPVLGRVASALTAKPTIGPESQATGAWKVGAEGERRVAEVLTGVPGIEVLHDRLIPGSRANIDHIVVGPSGVFVVDAKKHKGRVEARDVGKLWRVDMRLYVKGRDRTKLVDGALKQVDVVRGVLSDAYPDVKVYGVLCFIGSEWGGLVKQRQRVRGVVSLWPKALPRHVAEGGPLATRVSEVARYLDGQLRSAG